MQKLELRSSSLDISTYPRTELESWTEKFKTTKLFHATLPDIVRQNQSAHRLHIEKPNPTYYSGFSSRIYSSAINYKSILSCNYLLFLTFKISFEGLYVKTNLRKSFGLKHLNYQFAQAFQFILIPLDITNPCTKLNFNRKQKLLQQRDSVEILLKLHILSQTFSR